VSIVLAHHRRRAVHFNEHPTALWTAEQIIQAFPCLNVTGSYGEGFRERVRAMDVEEILTAPESPWQNPFAGRLP
jgi:hypothetical protein